MSCGFSNRIAWASRGLSCFGFWIWGLQLLIIICCCGFVLFTWILPALDCNVHLMSRIWGSPAERWGNFIPNMVSDGLYLQYVMIHSILRLFSCTQSSNNLFFFLFCTSCCFSWLAAAVCKPRESPEGRKLNPPDRPFTACSSQAVLFVLLFSFLFTDLQLCVVHCVIDLTYHARILGSSCHMNRITSCAFCWWSAHVSQSVARSFYMTLHTKFLVVLHFCVLVTLHKEPVTVYSHRAENTRAFGTCHWMVRQYMWPI